MTPTELAQATAWVMWANRHKEMEANDRLDNALDHVRSYYNEPQLQRYVWGWIKKYHAEKADFPFFVKNYMGGFNE